MVFLRDCGLQLRHLVLELLRLSLRLQVSLFLGVRQICGALLEGRLLILEAACFAFHPLQLRVFFLDVILKLVESPPHLRALLLERYLVVLELLDRALQPFLLLLPLCDFAGEVALHPLEFVAQLLELLLIVLVGSWLPAAAWICERVLQLLLERLVLLQVFCGHLFELHHLSEPAILLDRQLDQVLLGERLDLLLEAVGLRRRCHLRSDGRDDADAEPGGGERTTTGV
mmetsp:Transcript_28511/g.69522  ORF Transcript_28511/g.69522 Transcript_28511/m.69522 type:complete len:229 (+) Transcript_28511:2403-3089(+)